MPCLLAAGRFPDGDGLVLGRQTFKPRHAETPAEQIIEIEPPGKVEFRRSQRRQFPVDQTIDAPVRREHHVGRCGIAPEHVDARVDGHVLTHIGHRRIDYRHRPPLPRSLVPGLQRADVLAEAGFAVFGLGQKFKAVAPVDPGKAGKGRNGIGERLVALAGCHIHQPAFEIVVGILLGAFTFDPSHDKKGQAQDVRFEMHADPCGHGDVPARIERRHHLALQGKAAAEYHFKIGRLAPHHQGLALGAISIDIIDINKKDVRRKASAKCDVQRFHRNIAPFGLL